MRCKCGYYKPNCKCKKPLDRIIINSNTSLGRDGNDGKSAYDIAVEEGFIGTELEWLNSLKGEDGSPGAPGTIGPPGPPGADGNDGPPGEPGNICEAFETMPQSNAFGTNPQLFVHSDEGCRVVNVSTSGIFTDIRAFSSFVGTAIEGGTNNFRATIRNVSTVPVQNVKIDITLPSTNRPGESIVYGTPIISAPPGVIVTLVSNVDNIFTYDIPTLVGGEDVEISFPLTWLTKGTFQGSTLLTIVNSPTIDYSDTDDYSVASYTVNAKSEGEGTQDCPLIEISAFGRSLPVFSLPSNQNAINGTNLLTAGRVTRVPAVFTLNCNRPVTISLCRITSSGYSTVDINNSKKFKLAGTLGLNGNDGSLPYATVNATNNNQDFTITADRPISTVTELNNYGLLLIAVKAGPLCNPQYVSVLIDNDLPIPVQTLTLIPSIGTPTVTTREEYITTQNTIIFNSNALNAETGDTLDLLYTTNNSSDVVKTELLDFVLQSGTTYDFNVTRDVNLRGIINNPTFGNVQMSNVDANTVRVTVSASSTNVDNITNGLLKITFV